MEKGQKGLIRHRQSPAGSPDSVSVRLRAWVSDYNSLCVPEVLQSLALAQFSVQFSDLQAHQTQQDVQSVSLFPRLSEHHHMILEGSGQKS